mgnify:CR=1 FL=1
MELYSVLFIWESSVKWLSFFERRQAYFVLQFFRKQVVTSFVRKRCAMKGFYKCTLFYGVKPLYLAFLDVPWWAFSVYKFLDNRGVNKSKQTENYIEWLTTIELTAKQGFKSVIALQASAAFLRSFLAIAPTILLVGKDKKSTNQEVKNEQANDNQTAIKQASKRKLYGNPKSDFDKQTWSVL